MSLFTNQNFITQLLKQEGADEFFDQQGRLILQALIEIQTHKLVEKSSRHMHSDKRDYLTSQDIQNAMKQMSHEELIHLDGHSKQFSEGNSQQYILKDPISNVSTFIEEEMKQLPSFSMPNLKGRYIYLDKKIPKINQNHALKTMEDMKQIKVHQNQEKKKIFNIIRDEPASQLTKQEVEYYNEIVAYLTSGTGSNKGGQEDNICGAISPSETLSKILQNPILLQNGLYQRSSLKVAGSITNVIPLLLKFIINLGVNENCIAFLLQAIENKYVWESIQYHLHQILVILIAYEGIRSLEVGLKIGYIVNRFGDKYHNLYDIFENEPFGKESYSNIIKKIGFEIVTGIPLKLSLQKLKKIDKDCTSSSSQINQEAALCMKILVENWSKIQCLRSPDICAEYGHIYWYGCSKQLKDDPYLNMY